MDEQKPTLDEFLTYCRATFKFLDEFGFREIDPPQNRRNNPFQLWFKMDQRNVVITGEGWGTSASVYLEHDDGFELAEIYLVPEDKRPGSNKKRKSYLTQLEQISQSANWLNEYGKDFLEGDLERFFKLARPFPPHKRGN